MNNYWLSEIEQEESIKEIISSADSWTIQEFVSFITERGVIGLQKLGRSVRESDFGSPKSMEDWVAEAEKLCEDNDGCFPGLALLLQTQKISIMR